MLDRALIRRLATINSVPPEVIAATALASYGAQVFALIQGWPVWGTVLVTLLPWVPVLFSELRWSYRHYGWLALFYLLVLTQGGHVVEHVVQMFQIHVLGQAPRDAHGIFGALDLEWVHFIWNSWVLLAVVVLLFRFRTNRWLWLTAGFAAWHELEHVVMMSTYLATGLQGTPGLLSRGGVIGSPFIRPDVHFAYNVVETAPLMLAFIAELKRSYDLWLRRAMPHLDERALAAATNMLQVRRFAAGEEIVREGELPEAFYVITQGQVVVTRRGTEDAVELRLRRLGPGEHFGEIALLGGTPGTASVRAFAPTEVLVIDQRTFRALVASSEATERDLRRIVEQRLGAAIGS